MSRSCVQNMSIFSDLVIMPSAISFPAPVSFPSTPRDNTLIGILKQFLSLLSLDGLSGDRRYINSPGCCRYRQAPGTRPRGGCGAPWWPACVFRTACTPGTGIRPAAGWPPACVSIGANGSRMVPRFSPFFFEKRRQTLLTFMRIMRIIYL